MSKVLVFLTTVVLFAGFVLLTLPLAVGRLVDRRWTGQLPSPRPPA
jgi:hypothetical protein